METHFLDYEGSSLHFIRFGEGSRLLFCFHGFGEMAESFSILAPSLGKRYKVIAIDLPLHGKTVWPSGKLFLKEDLKKVIAQLLIEFKQEHFSLMGFSMGGKMALTAVTLFPGKVDEVFLIAPDGLKRNVWYDMSIYPEWGRRLFKRLIENPERYFGLIKFLTALRLLPASMQKFLLTQLETKEKRQKVFDVWDTIKDFRIDKKKAKEILNEYKVKLYLFFGQFDSVIKPRLGQQFVKGLTNYRIVVLPKGHTLIKDYLNQSIEEVLGKS